MWAYRIPFLPDIGYDRDQIDSPISLLGYHALAEALAASGSHGSAIQIRLVTRGPVMGEPGVVEPFIVGRSQSREAATRLASLVRATLPAEVPLEAFSLEADIGSLLDHVVVHEEPVAAVAEIRRRVEELDPVPGSALDSSRTLPGVQRWAPDVNGLRVACSVLARHATPAVVVLHMEPRVPSLEMLDRLDSVVREIAQSGDPAENPLRRSIAVDNLRRLRNLPRAALEVRVQVAAEESIEPGLLETIGISLTAEEAFAVIRPRDELELLLASELISHAESRWWGSSGDDVVDELLRVCDSAEAAAVVRLPSPLRGGSPGLPSVPLSTLPRSGLIRGDDTTTGIYLGSAAGGGIVHVSLDELNRHLLVAGLPGFGKTISVQRLMGRLWTEHRIPFLVLDPAKSDYVTLANEIGPDATVIRLGPEEPSFNPFAIPQGCTPHGHAGRILAAFDSAFGLSANWPMGYVTLARGLFAAYEGQDESSAPTLRSVIAQVGDTLRRSALSGPDGANARAALLARLEFLVRGPLGAALTGAADEGIDWSSLLRGPVIIEMREFGGPSERALMFALLLAGLISYREANPMHGGLGHVTVLEEAHRVLRESSQESEGVRLFVEAIAELRGSGEGFVIVDQAPTLLHPGVLKLSGSVMSHRLIDPNERAVVGAAVLLDSRQQQDLARLETGQAILFSSQRTNSVVVDVDAASAQGSAESAMVASSLVPGSRGELPYCIGCQQMCLHHDRAMRLTRAHPAPVTKPEGILEAFEAHTADVGLRRCAAGMSWAAQSRGKSIRSFLAGLRRLDDATVAAYNKQRISDQRSK